jgi:hypothetical protein
MSDAVPSIRCEESCFVLRCIQCVFTKFDLDCMGRMLKKAVTPRGRIEG